MTLAEIVQLKRAEEQANSARVRWEFRTQTRRAGSRPVRKRGGVRRLPVVVSSRRPARRPRRSWADR